MMTLRVEIKRCVLDLELARKLRIRSKEDGALPIQS